MKKFLGSLAVLLLVMTLIPSMASAKDKTGGFGIGGDATLAGIDGISARYQIAKNFGLQVVLGFDYNSSDTKSGSTVTNSSTMRDLQLAIRGDVGIAFTKKTNLGVVFGVNTFNNATKNEPQGGEAMETSDTNFTFEAGLKAEYFFTGFFSVYAETGFTFAFKNEDSGEGGNDMEGYEMKFGVAEPFGAAGWTFWFN